MGIFQRLRDNGGGNEGQLACLDLSAESEEILGAIAAGEKSVKAGNQAPTYGVQDVIELMQSLPDVEQTVLVRVVKKTLESADIRVSDIIVDGEYKETAIESQIQSLTTEVEKYKTEIDRRKGAISAAKTMLEEVTKVVELLKLAQKSQIKERLSNTEKQQSVSQNVSMDLYSDAKDHKGAEPR